jgi:hypothetical protein
MDNINIFLSTERDLKTPFNLVKLRREIFSHLNIRAKIRSNNALQLTSHLITTNLPHSDRASRFLLHIQNRKHHIYYTDIVMTTNGEVEVRQPLAPGHIGLGCIIFLPKHNGIERLACHQAGTVCPDGCFMRRKAYGHPVAVVGLSTIVSETGDAVVNVTFVQVC